MDVRLEMIESYSSSKIQALGQNMTLLVSTSAFANWDPQEINASLRSYRISSLFMAGEDINVYNPENEKITDNNMTLNIKDKNSPFPYFDKVRPAHLFVGPNLWTNGIPHRVLGVGVPNPKTGDGVMTLDFNYRRLFNFWAEQGFGSSLFAAVFDESGRFIFYPEMSKVRQGLYLSDVFENWNSPKEIPFYLPKVLNNIDGKAYAVVYRWSEAYQLGYLLFMPRQEILAGAFELLTSLYFMLGIALVVSLIGTLSLARRLSQPITLLADNMVQLSEGNLTARTHLNRQDEIGMLSKGFDTMAESLHNKVLELAEHKNNLEAEVKQRTLELQKSNEKLEQLSRTDPLTGLSNRRDLLEKINYEILRMERSHLSFALVLLDVDHFKKFNDTWGHECGDEVLKMLSRVLLELNRKPDHVGRWGGEEFLLVLPETTLENGVRVAERLRKRIENESICWKNQDLRITLTMGVSIYDPELGVDGSIDLADKRLYLGKNAGRNRVVAEGGEIN